MLVADLKNRIKWTRGGEVYLHDEVENKYYTIPPSNVRGWHVWCI